MFDLIKDLCITSCPGVSRLLEDNPIAGYEALQLKQGVLVDMLWIVAIWFILFNGALALYIYFVVKPHLSRLKSKESEKTMETK